MKIEVGKEYKLSNGDAVRIIGKMNRESRPYVGIVTPKDGSEEYIAGFEENGASVGQPYIVPPEQYAYMNVYERGTGLYVSGCHPERVAADGFADSNRVGCIKVKLERRFDD